MNFIDVNGRDSIYVIDSPTRPRDKGVMGETYTGLLYVEINGVISGPYRGSSYPNSVSTTDNSPKWKTLNEGAFPFNNKYGHSEGSQYGLNIVNEKVLIVLTELDENICLSSRNMGNVKVIRTDEVNTLDVVTADKMVITASALNKLQEALSNE